MHYHYNQLEIHSETLCYGLWNVCDIEYALSKNISSGLEIDIFSGRQSNEMIRPIEWIRLYECVYVCVKVCHAIDIEITLV